MQPNEVYEQMRSRFNSQSSRAANAAAADWYRKRQARRVNG